MEQPRQETIVGQQLPSLQAAAEERWVEVIVKASHFDRVLEARDSIRVGDVVSFEGRYQDDESSILTCLGFEVLQRWREVSGGASFAPRVPPRRQHGKHAARNGHGAVGEDQQARQQQQQNSEKAQQQKQQQRAEQQQEQRATPNSGTTTAAEAPGAVQPSPAPATAAAVVAAPQLQLCKFYVNSGQCLKGDACPYAHVAAAARGAVLQSWVRRRTAERRANAEREGCCHVAGAASKRYRARVFARWLVGTFGRDALNQGAGVLDIAAQGAEVARPGG
ncbi:hypothetical protein MNEG_2591 [Monoraphidium neglectum]|uniref:C3H1-type domain-containing protein n=1 Tax=Monoraphidium neglectum TaxID=145388 RepID=A0A0D2LFF6_9CHLO|nr:hypothetical protein MNEG_2591 [Monoraphidium neglectum]KIZ05374.1 hypothetical protein MNEG_2591 [Monoraphidium neglectum]|eukprot:XP_013904393.1 hypothetical protein MNEG_2591 [Monoraphidium neglectum]